MSAAKNTNSDVPARDFDALEQAAAGTAAAVVTGSVMRTIREWSDSLVFAFILAMFIRTFVVELFKIPSGSMSPTLLGDVVAEGPAVDANGNTAQFLLIHNQHDPERVQVFRRDATNHYRNEGFSFVGRMTASQRALLRQDAHREEHRILVNKFAYWFAPPKRADIVIFRVPFAAETDVYTRDGHPFRVPQYNRDMAVYVKRCVANAGELVAINADGELVINNEPAHDAPVIRDHLRYKPEPKNEPFSITVPKNELFAFGDNTDNSLDSRYWDGVPYTHLRGKAFLRYAPVKKAGFLN